MDRSSFNTLNRGRFFYYDINGMSYMLLDNLAWPVKVQHKAQLSE